MNLVVDIGNTTAKAWVFKCREIVSRATYPVEDPAALLAFLRETGADHAILAASGAVDEEIKAFLEKVPGIFLEAGPATALPFRNLYRSPETLGYDRVANVAGALELYPGEDVLVIDTGTAVTYDYLTAAGVYLGGNISPGLAMRFRALATFTARLPRVEAEGETPLLGTTTEEAIRSGVVQGLTDEIDAAIDRFRTRTPSLRVVLTGGDAFFFEKKLKNSIFVHPELGAYGLNRILKMHVEK